MADTQNGVRVSKLNYVSSIRMYMSLRRSGVVRVTLEIESDNYKRLEDASTSNGNLEDLYIFKSSQTLLYTYYSSYDIK